MTDIDMLHTDPWISFLDTPVAKLAKTYYLFDSRRKYHNWDHIEKMFFHARVTFEFNFDINLAVAILFHDAIYDHLPEKELRSAKLFLEIYEIFGPMDGVDPNKVHTLILDTCDHDCKTGDYRISMLDLADLADPVATLINADNIWSEGCELSNMDTLSPIQNVYQAQDSITFLQQLRQTVVTNKSISSNHKVFWDNVIDGIDAAIDKYALILQD